MGVSTRHFLVTGDEIRPLTQSVNDRLRRGEAVLPGYAGQDVHVVDVAVEVKDGAPVRVRDISTTILSLDGRGALRSRLLEDLRAALSASRRGRAPAPARGSPSPAQLDRVTDLALGRAKSKLKPPRAVAEPGARRSSSPRNSGGRARRRVAAGKAGG